MKNILEKIINDKKESLILIKKNNSLDSFFNITEKILGAGKLGNIG